MKYRVLKDFIGQSGLLFSPGVTITNVQPMDYYSVTFYKGLLDHGFIEEIKDEPWKPEKSDEYWFVWHDGSIVNINWGDSNGDDARIAIGNCFQTKEQAEKAAEWLKAFKVLRDDTKGFKPDWNNPDQDKFSVFYDHTDKCFNTIEHCDTQAELIVFATKADAEESIKNHRSEWLTFLNIEEGE